MSMHSEILGAGAFAGLFIHQTFFIRGEWHVQAPDIVVCHGIVLGLIVAGAFIVGSIELRSVVANAALALLSYCIALFTSIVIYRFFLHPLTRAGFPGPSVARVSKLWHSWASRQAKSHRVLDSLNRKYGDFVRTGPSEVTVFNPEVFAAVDGPKTDCTKGEWYDFVLPLQSLVTCRDKEVHAARRRQWHRGFSSTALAQYEAKALKYIGQLDRCIEFDTVVGKSSNVSDLFRWFTFDTMSDFAFNRSTGMLQSGEWHHIILILQQGMALLGPFSPVPDWFVMCNWAEQQMRDRTEGSIDVEGEQPDLAHYIIEDAKASGFSARSWDWLRGDTLLAVIAGSDTTATTLTGIFSELARCPSHADKIYDEVRDLDVSDVKLLSSLQHLDGVINEGLRLYSAVPTGGARKTSERGLTVAGTYIPPHTTIMAPRFSISRREDCFERAHDFVPERWYARPEMVRNKAAFAPFALGQNSCVGRILALDIMRLFIARLIKGYRVQFAPGDNGERVLGDMKDQFVAALGQLDLMFEKREYGSM